MSNGGSPPRPDAAMPPGESPLAPPPSDGLGWGILATVLCCSPVGIVAIVVAATVNDRWARGDVEGARDAARKARRFALWGAIGSLALVVLYAGLFVVLGRTGSDA